MNAILAPEAEPQVATCSRSRFALDLADERDDPELRDLLRRHPMGRRIRVTFEREPSFFAAARVQGDFRQVGVGRDVTTGRIIGMGARSIASAYLNGRPAPLGYLSDLRLIPENRGGLLVARGYRYLRKLHQDGRAKLYYTVIVSDNAKALSTIAAGRAGLPPYHDCGLILCPAIVLKRPKLPVRADCEIVRGDEELLPQIVACLNRNNCRRQFAPVHCVQDFAPGGRWRDFRVQDFYVARRKARVIGVIGKWDQQSFKQTRIVGYGGALGVLRHLLRLPAVGQCLRYFYGSFAAVDGDDPGVFRALLRRMYNDAVGGEYRYFLVGLHELDPLCSVLGEYSITPFAGRLFCVCFEDGEPEYPELDARVPYIEIATL